MHLVTDGLASLAATVVSQDVALTVSPRQPSNRDPLRWIDTMIIDLKTAIG